MKNSEIYVCVEFGNKDGFETCTALFSSSLNRYSLI